MMNTRMSVDMRNLSDVGLTAVAELRTTPVSLSSAVALLDLLSTTVNALMEDARERDGWDDSFVLVPIIELQTGSLKAVLKFLTNKKDELTTQIVTGIVSGVAVAWITFQEPPEPPGLPECPISVTQQVQPKMETVVQELDATKKPYEIYYRADGCTTEFRVKGNLPPPKP